MAWQRRLFAAAMLGVNMAAGKNARCHATLDGHGEGLTPQRFRQIVASYGQLKVVVAGDFCLDRYLEIDPALEETSLETGLPAHQVVNVRSQPGGAGNVLANVAALGPATVSAVGICGCDGEGHELIEALEKLGADLKRFVRSHSRRTFTYTKPLVMRPGRPPEELPRLDIRDRQGLDNTLALQFINPLLWSASQADALILMEQATLAGTGVFTPMLKAALKDQWEGSGLRRPRVMIADSRCDIAGFVGMDVKVNRQELRHACGRDGEDESLAGELAKWRNGRVFVTLGADGLLAANRFGEVVRVPGIPVAPPIDVVGCGDTVLAHLAMALAAGATTAEAAEIANLAGVVVVKKIGTTGTATVEEVARLVGEV